MMEVQNEPAAPEQRVIEPNGHFVWMPHQDDAGLGFGMGSTQGVFNTYGRRGFLRPELPPIDRATRRQFNLRGYRGARENWGCGWPYACHYDPEPFYKEEAPSADDDVWARHTDYNTGFLPKERIETKKVKITSSQIVFISLALVLIGAILFARRA